VDGVVVLAVGTLSHLALEEDLLLVRQVIPVGISEDENAVRDRHDHRVAEHAQSVHAIDVGVLIKDLAGVGASVAVAILQNQDAVARGARLFTVIERLGHPHASTMVDVNAGWIEQLLLGGKGSDHQAGGHAEDGPGSRAGLCQLLRTQDGTDSTDAQEEEEGTFHARLAHHASSRSGER